MSKRVNEYGVMTLGQFKGVIDPIPLFSNPENLKGRELEISRRCLCVTKQFLHESFRVWWPTKELLHQGFTPLASIV